MAKRIDRKPGVCGLLSSGCSSCWTNMSSRTQGYAWWGWWSTCNSGLERLSGRCWGGMFIASWEVKVRTSPCLGKMCQVCGVGREGSRKNRETPLQRSGSLRLDIMCCWGDCLRRQLTLQICVTCLLTHSLSTSCQGIWDLHKF